MKRPRFRRPKGPQGWLVLLCLGAVVAYGGLSSIAWYMQSRVRKALAAHDEAAATGWMARAHWVPLRRAATCFLEARLARHRRDHAAMQQHLEQAAARGFDPELLMREGWLARAEMGEMEMLTNQMAMLLTDPRGDEVEIVQSYVKGLIRVGRHEAAAEMLEAWVKDYPGDPYPVQLLGSVLVEMDRWDDAEKTFREVLRLQPDNPRAAFGLGTVLVTQQKTASAIRYLEFAAGDKELQVDAVVAQARCHRALDNPGRALQLLEALVAESPRRSVIVELAQLNLDQGDFKLAAERIKPLVDENSREVDARYIYAQALRQLDRQEEAEGHFTAIMEINRNLALANELAERIGDGPESIDDRLQVARIQMQYGTEQEALRWLVDSFRIDNLHRPTIEALYEYYDRKAKENPGDGDVRLRRGEFHQRLKQLKPKDHVPHP